MTPAVPPLPTSWNLPFQPCVGSHTSNCTAGLVTPTTRQIGSATVPTGFGLAPAGSSCARLIVVSGSASAASAAQVFGCAADAAPAASARATAAAILVLLVIDVPLVASFHVDVLLEELLVHRAAHQEVAVRIRMDVVAEVEQRIHQIRVVIAAHHLVEVD